MYTKFDDFFDHYIGIVEKQVPNYEDLLELPNGHTYIHPLLTPLTREQVKELNLVLRIILKIPPPIALVYDRTASTFYSTFDRNRQKYIIGYPTMAYYLQEFPSILKAAMKHEMGHILNKDAFASREKAHSDCTNRCMDARINIHIPHEEMDYLTRCLFAFKNEPGVRYVNAEHFYKQLHLPPSPGGYSWETAHEVYHQFDKEPDDDNGGGGGGGGTDGTPGGDPGGDPAQGGGDEDDQEDIEDIDDGFPDPIPEDDEDGEDENGGGGGDEDGGDGGDGGKKGGKPGDKDGKKGDGDDGDGDDGEGGDSPSKKAKKRQKMKKLDAQIQKSIKALEKLKQKF